MTVYTLLTLGGREGLYESREDDKAELQLIGCSLHDSLEAAKAAAAASFHKWLGDDYAEGYEDYEDMLDWCAYGQSVLPPSDWTRWSCGDLFGTGYFGAEIRLLPIHGEAVGSPSQVEESAP